MEVMSLKTIKRILPEILGSNILISRSEAAEQYGKHKNTLRNWESDHGLTPILKDNEVYYNRIQLYEEYKKRTA